MRPPKESWSSFNCLIYFFLLFQILARSSKVFLLPDEAENRQRGVQGRLDVRRRPRGKAAVEGWAGWRRRQEVRGHPMHRISQIMVSYSLIYISAKHHHVRKKTSAAYKPGCFQSVVNVIEEVFTAVTYGCKHLRVLRTKL